MAAMRRTRLRRRYPSAAAALPSCLPCLHLPLPALSCHPLAGVDGGTESIRAGVFDLAGTPLSFASHPYPTAFPHPGWAEQDPADW